MSISRRIAATLSGLVLAGAVASGPALAATDTTVHSNTPAGQVATAKTDPSQGFCNPEEDGDLDYGGDGHLYRCGYVWGLGWYWQPA